MNAPAGTRERSESRLGFLLGAAVAFLVAALFALHVFQPFARLDLAMVDYFFRWRPEPPASGEITMIYFDDVAARQRKRVKREDTARVVRALTRLGAKLVMLDVEYVSDFSNATAASETGQLPLDDETRFLARAIEANGRTLINYNFERPLEHIDGPLARAAINRLKERLSAEPRDLPDLPAAGRDDVASAFGSLRLAAATERVAELLAAEPGLSFADVRRRLLSDRDAEANDGAVGDILRGYHANRVMKVFAVKEVPREIRGTGASWREQGLLRPTIPEFAERVLTASHATTQDRDIDGVLRRAPLVIRTPFGPALYTGLEVAAKALEDSGHRSKILIEEDAVTVQVLDRPTGEVTRAVRIPVEADGLVLADWGTPFDALSFAKLLEEDIRRTRLLTTNLARVMPTAAGYVGPDAFAPTQARFDDLAARRKRAETDLAAPISEFADVDRDTENVATQILAQLKTGVAYRRENIARMPPARRPEMLAEVAKTEEQMKDLEAALADHPEVRRRIQGRICFFGSKSTETGDMYSSPMGAETPGVDLHANTAAMILRGRVIRTAPGWLNFALISAFGLAVAAGVSSWSLLRGSLLTAAVVVSSIALFAGVGLHSSVLLSGAGPAVCAFATFTVAVSWRELVARRSQRRLQKELARHTSPALVAIIMADPERFSRPRQTEATIFFSDIKGFTGISEKMDAEQLIGFMNRYHDRMTQILMDRRAYLDKYIGDGIMALFGVPVETPDHAKLACYAALENVAAAQRLSEEFQREGLPGISIRVGLNSGSIVAAYVGASDRADYTAIGDAVNLASRLEGANKGYGSAIMASGSTYQLAKDAFRFRELDIIRVVGKTQGIRVYELLGQRDQPDPFPEGFLAAYHEGINAFEAREWSKAREHFDRALAIMPDDKPARMYATRCSGFELSPPSRDWDGVFDLSEK